MSNSIKEKKSLKYFPTEKGQPIQGNDPPYKKKEYLNQRVITEYAEEHGNECRKKNNQFLKMQVRSVSPKIRILANFDQNNKSLITNNTKPTKLKSPTKQKLLTQTGRPIPHPHHNQKSKNNHKHKSPTNTKLSKQKKPKIKKTLLYTLPTNKKINIKSQGSFDSTLSCLFKNQIEIIGIIGQGTFGQVYKGKCKDTGEIVAIKRVLQDKKYKNRQIEIVNMLDNPFVMKVLGSYLLHQDGRQYLNIVMRYYECDLYYHIKQHEKTKIDNFDIKLLSYQVFRGLLYLHSRNICHRDIKPHNILLKARNAVICDFGSAKILRQGQPNLSYICSRCYRAPELIFGARYYTTMIDIWSMGCVLLEIINQVPVFIGESSVDHLIEVIKVLGTPSKREVMDMNPEYDMNDYKFPKIKKKQWRKIFPQSDPLLLDLIDQVMLYSPKQRLTAAEALAHDYFDQLREEVNYGRILKLTGLDSIFNFSNVELDGNEHLIPKLIPQWYNI